METEHRRDFPAGGRRRRPAWHQTELSEGLAPPVQTHSESDSWHRGTRPGTMISSNLFKCQAGTFLSSICQHPLSAGMSRWTSSGLHYYKLIHTQISQVSHKIFLNAALITNLSHMQHKKTTAHMAEC